MKRFLAALLLLLASLAVGLAEEEAPNFKKMRVKQLKALLDDRGVSSDSIKEKDDLVKLAAESWPLPVVEKKPEPVPEPPIIDLASSDNTDMDMDSILRSLKDEEKRKADTMEKMREQGFNMDNGAGGGGGGGGGGDGMAEIIARLEAENNAKKGGAKAGRKKKKNQKKKKNVEEAEL